MTRLAGKSAIITGASGALGSDIARRFVAEGVRAIALVDLDSNGIESLADELRHGEVDIVAVALDVTDHDDVAARYAETAERFGGLDIAVNNAGVIAPSARIHNVDPDDLRRVLDINLGGIFHCLKAAVIAMRAAGGGAIVNTASVAGFTTWTHNSPYGLSKAAVIQLTKLAAAEYSSEKIRVNCVSPGTFVTSFHDELSSDALEAVRSRHPLGRFGETDEIAGAYVYLASDEADWVTGTSLVIDGGMSIG